MNGLLDCPLCGLPLEPVTRWEGSKTEVTPKGIKKVKVPMVQCRCVRGHWYAGPLDDLLESQ